MRKIKVYTPLSSIDKEVFEYEFDYYEVNRGTLLISLNQWNDCVGFSAGYWFRFEVVEIKEGI